MFVISDLHLGGGPGSQICHAYSELADFIRWVMAEGRSAPPSDLELVVNGDLVDFLADDARGDPALAPRAWTPDEGEAVAKLERIAGRARGGDNGGVFEALCNFLAAGHRLTLLPGNHDVELALPAVRRHLTRLLGAENARFQFLYDGEAYVVGGVLLEHGNRYDRWNRVDQSALRQERSVRSRRLPVREEDRRGRYFVPPAGTCLVVDFLNRIKERYRFIDVLKPEDNAALPLLLALEPDYRPHLKSVIKAGLVAGQLFRQGGIRGPATPRRPGDLRNTAGFPAREEATPAMPPLSGGVAGTLEIASALPGPRAESAPDVLGPLVPEPPVSLEEVLTETLGPDARYFVEPATANEGELGLLTSVMDAAFWASTRAGQLQETARSLSQVLKIRQARIDEQRLRQLHAALRRLNRDDRSFELTFETAGYLDAARETAARGGFEVIAYGHTHLPKKVCLGPGGGAPWYFNTGTWCDVLRLPGAVTASYAEASSTLEAFLSSVRANDFGRYIRRYRPFLEIEVDPDATSRTVRRAELYFYGGHGQERSAPPADLSTAPRMPPS
jgi:UDP-2,3-diacylglucosamine pyrophosphatase LpxH